MLTKFLYVSTSWRSAICIVSQYLPSAAQPATDSPRPQQNQPRSHIMGGFRFKLSAFLLISFPLHIYAIKEVFAHVIVRLLLQSQPFTDIYPADPNPGREPPNVQFHGLGIRHPNSTIFQNRRICTQHSGP